MEDIRLLITIGTLILMGVITSGLLKFVDILFQDNIKELSISDYVKNYIHPIINRLVLFCVCSTIAFIAYLFINITSMAEPISNIFTEQTSSPHLSDYHVTNYIFLLIDAGFYIVAIVFFKQALQLRKHMLLSQEAKIKQQKVINNKLEQIVTANLVWRHLSIALLTQTLIFFGLNSLKLAFTIINLHLIWIFLSTIPLINEANKSQRLVRAAIFMTVFSIIMMTTTLYLFENFDLYRHTVTTTQTIAYLIWIGVILILLLSDYSHMHYLNSVVDTLTGIYNRRYFVNQLRQFLSEPNNNETWLALIICDIDDFKKINDTYGHDVGDRAIRHFAQQLRAQIREHDVIARIGGEEFAIILPNTDLATAQQIAKRMCKTMRLSPITLTPKAKQTVKDVTYSSFSVAGDTLPNQAAVSEETISFTVTGSFGVTAYQISTSLPQKPTIDERSDQLIKHADTAMYQAKTSGKNKVEVFQYA